MFGRKKNKTIENADIALVQGAIPESVPVAAPGLVEKTVIGKHIYIEGTIRGDEHLLIEGSIKGMVDMPKNEFHLGTNGRFEGEIHALNVNIGGQMEGEIKSIERVVITKDANFQGDIKSKTISLEDGAYFKGYIELEGRREKENETSKTTDGEQQNKTTVAGNKSDVTTGKYTKALEYATKKKNKAGKTSDKEQQGKANAADIAIDKAFKQSDPDKKS